MKILTFDLEEWFHLLDVPSIKGPDTWRCYAPRFVDNTRRIIEMLERHDLKATFYCLGWIADQYPTLIRELSEKGHEIGCYSHTLAYQQSPDEFRADLIKSMASISEATGKPVESYRAPGFSVTENNLWVFDILCEVGIRYDSSIFPSDRAHGGILSFGVKKPCHISTLLGNKIIELPINTTSILGREFVFSGGGYFRILPYPVLKFLFGSKDYVMTYFHPRDFDPEQPVIPGLSLFRRFKSYVGLKGASRKLSKLFGQFKFVDSRTFIQASNVDEWAVVDLNEIKSCR